MEAHIAIRSTDTFARIPTHRARHIDQNHGLEMICTMYDAFREFVQGRCPGSIGNVRHLVRVFVRLGFFINLKNISWTLVCRQSLRVEMDLSGVAFVPALDDFVAVSNDVEWS